MSYRFPQVIWLAIYFQNIFQAPRIVQIIMVFGRYRGSERIRPERSQGVSGFGLFVPAVLFTTPCAIVCSAHHSRQQRGVEAPGALSRLSPLTLCKGSVYPPLGSDWPLALDWNWLHKGYNNETLLIFCGGAGGVSKDGILLSLEQLGSILTYCLVVRALRSEWAFDPRDTVFLIGLYWSILLLFMAAQSWWMSVHRAEWKTEVTGQMLPRVQPGCLGDVWCQIRDILKRMKLEWQKRHH